MGSWLARPAWTSRTVRYYHQHGLIPEPVRNASGYREYGDAHLVRLLEVRRLREAGVPLADISTMIDAPQADVSRKLRAQAGQVEDEIRRLQSVRESIILAAHGWDDVGLPEGSARAALSASDDVPDREGARGGTGGRLGGQSGGAASQEAAEHAGVDDP